MYSSVFIWVPASKVNIQKRGDKYYTYDKFAVQQISYNEKREISGLIIVNQGGEAVYVLKDSADNKSKISDNVQEPAGQSMSVDKIEAINKELARTGVALDAVLNRYGISSIQEMSASNYRNAMNSLKKTKAKAA